MSRQPYAQRQHQPGYWKGKRVWNASPRGRYCLQKAGAKRRGIAWEFTFESWWAMWEASGKWTQRGNRPGQFCMGRFGDVGPYAVANCEIIEFKKNFLDGHAKIVRHGKRYKQVTFIEGGDHGSNQDAERVRIQRMLSSLSWVGDGVYSRSRAEEMEQEAAVDRAGVS